MSILKRLFSGGKPKRAPLPAFNAPVLPDEAFFAIGDIHGSHNHLIAALSGIEEQAKAPTIICVGDYVDRGEQSADVLRTLKERSDRLGSAFVCLMGNHEQMMLKFLDDPEANGERWLRYGGLQTIASFGVGLGPKRDLVTVRHQLTEAMGHELTEWLRTLPTQWVSGNVAVVHAGADPLVPIKDQRSAHLLWGHPEFEIIPRNDGVWVVHGHTIVPDPYAEQGRIAIDTGAYATGKLSVAHIFGSEVEFLRFYPL